MENKNFKGSYYIRYVIVKLSKFVQISMQTSLDLLWSRILWKLIGPGNSFQVTYFIEFFDNFFFCDITWTDQISLINCVYFSSYSVKCVSCFMLRHLITWWHLNIWKVNKRALEVKQKTFLLSSRVLYFRLIKQTSQNLADTTFNDLKRSNFWSL